MNRFEETWAAYSPVEKTPWNLRRVVHLHRRAGFAATWDELQRDLRDEPMKCIDRLLEGKPTLHSPADFATTAKLLGDAAVAGGEIARLKAWWFYRMTFGPDPLGEKLTLVWHDHFATANSKVHDSFLIRRQNEAIRQHARGKFADLLHAMAREPALLNYLDAQANRKGHPNENFARELMELFTLGVGHYTETDVKEAARALTGWAVDEGQFAEVKVRHDEGDKTILGETANFSGTSLLGLLLKQPATAERIAMKLCRQFFGEKAISPEATKTLAIGLREHDLDIGWAVGTILKSKLFFAEGNLGNRVLSPVEYVVGSARALGLFDPAPSTLAMADWSARIGQDVFDPPNVGGWPPGRAWITTRGMIARANYASAIVTGPNLGLTKPYDATALPKKFDVGSDAGAVLTFHHRLLFGTEPTAELRRRLNGLDSGKVVAALLSSPEGQLS